MKPEEFPKSLLVMGSGAIGIEFASFYRSMGVDVTVVETAAADHAGRGCGISALARSSSKSAA